MAKYSGYVGYGVQKEVSPGIWEDAVVEKFVKGDVISLSADTTPSDAINDTLLLNHRISIIGDLFSYQNFTTMKYITYMGAKWKVKSISVHRPRLELTIGGVYNG